MTRGLARRGVASEYAAWPAVQSTFIPMSRRVQNCGNKLPLWPLGQTISDARNREQLVLPDVLERGANTQDVCL